jgi:hypothetical protein
MIKSFSKLIAITSIFACVSLAHAGWDVSINEGQNQLLASSNSFASDGQLRFATQMISTNTPDANGFLYVENIAQYNCEKNAYQLVKAIGYKSWNDQGVSIDSTLGKWTQVVAGTAQQSMMNKLCNFSVADASSTINK